MLNLQETINQANKKTRSTLNKQFARKSSNDQLLDRITTASRAVLDATAGNNTAALKIALRELETLTKISERRPK